MTKNTDNFLAAIQRFERVVDGQARSGQEQQADLDQALAGLEEAVCLHADSLREPEELLDHLDGPRIPSPGLDRRTQNLRDELAAILENIRSLRAQVHAEGQPPAVDVDPATLAGALPVAPEVGGVVEHGILLQRARQFIQTLEAFENEEADVILDTVNTDIGAGD
jgi:hypothetical protein